MKFDTEGVKRWAKERQAKHNYQEVIDWLKEYAKHGGDVPLNKVLADIEAHSPFMREAHYIESLE